MENSNAVLLSNGWYAVKLADNLWQIVTENGVVLGVLHISDDDIIIEEYDIEYIIQNMILKENVMTYEEAIANGIIENPKGNPATGDSIIILLLVLILICAGAAVITKKKYEIR